jgi:hypothetical protein
MDAIAARYFTGSEHIAPLILEMGPKQSQATLPWHAVQFR